MTETQCGWSNWLSPGQPAATPGVCAACGLRRSYGDVKRCMNGGPATQERPQSSGIGDRLAAIFGKLGIIPGSSCSCNDIKANLNGMTPEQVAKWAELPDIIMANSTGWARWIVRLLPWIARWIVRRAIRAAATRTAGVAAPDAPSQR
jgi:hypothetical protein